MVEAASPALLAALVAFAPSFSFILIGAERFDRLRANETVRAFLNGADLALLLFAQCDSWLARAGR